MSIRIEKTLTATAPTLTGLPVFTANLNTLTDSQDASYLDIGKQASGFRANSGIVDYRRELVPAAYSGTGLTFRYGLGTRSSQVFGGDWTSYYAGAPTHMNGEYTVMWNGGDAATVGQGLGDLDTFSADLGGATATATAEAYDHSVTFMLNDAFPVGGNVQLEFTGVDAADLPTRVRVVKSDQLTRYRAGHIWQQRMIDKLNGFAHTLRFMEYLDTNGSNIVAMVGQTPSTHPQWQGAWTTSTAYVAGDVVQEGGVNYVCTSDHTSGTFYTDYDNDEWECGDYPDETWGQWLVPPISALAQLCNECSAHAWVNIPHQMQDAGVTSFLTAIHADMDAGLKCLVEYSNEVWNNAGGFDQRFYVEARALADWGVTGNSGQTDRQSWYGKRSYQVMQLANAVNATRFQGGIFGQRGGATTSTIIALDAPTWSEEEPGSYVAPHTAMTFYGCTDYIGTAGQLHPWVDGVERDTWLELLSENWDSGDNSLSVASFLSTLDTDLIDRKSALLEHINVGTAVDTVDGLTRSLRFRTYEGVSLHINIGNSGNSRFSAAFRPLPWATNKPVIQYEFRVNQYGRMYQATAAGTTGATEPTHKNQGDVSDGTVTWTDVTGLNNSSYRDLTGYLDVTDSTLPSRSTIPALSDWATTTVYGADAYVQNANGGVYKTSAGGTSGATEPTHLTGDVSDGAVTWTYVVMGLGELNARPEIMLYLGEFLWSSAVGDYFIQLMEYAKSLGGEGHAIFTFMAPYVYTGPWGKLKHWEDESGEVFRMLMNWQRANPRWWTD